MPKLFDIFESKALAAYWEDTHVDQNNPHIGTKFFPVAKRTGLSLAWIKGKNNLPVALQPAAFDTKAPLRDRIGIKELSTEMPFFREAMRIGEKDRQDIETLLARGEEFALPTIQKIYDDVATLVDGALVQSERMAMSLLHSGQINITATADTGRDISYVYNYDVDSSWGSENTLTLASGYTWTTTDKATNDPIKDIWDIVSLMAENKGVKIVNLLMNTSTFKGMLTSNSIKNGMTPLNANAIISDKQKKQFVQDQTEMNFIIYDGIFKDEQGKDRKYYPDGYVTFLPSYTLGNTWYGTTPEEFDLLGKNTQAASVSIVNTGIAITTITEPHPVNVQTIVSEIVLPSFERMNDIFVLKVF